MNGSPPSSLSMGGTGTVYIDEVISMLFSNYIYNGEIYILNNFFQMLSLFSRYTIQLEHGQFKWSVVRNYRDFTLLNNRLRAHRAAKQILAPVRRAQERMDAMLENIGVDIIPDHKEDCPYYKRPGHSHKRRHSKLEVLKRTADVFDTKKVVAPIATIESPTPTSEEVKLKMEQAVQCSF
uniref:PX domain-containing protein n=1 Tax=Heterorhabditis bacteriophora TaxID=37862 RepID=A0A1I7XBB7_HETBA